MAEEKPLEWRRIVEILRIKGLEMLAAKAALAAEKSPAATPEAQRGAGAASTAGLSEPSSGVAENASKKKKKKKKKQQADSVDEKPVEAEGNEPTDGGPQPSPPSFVFTAGTKGAPQDGVRVSSGAPPSIRTVPTETLRQHSSGFERTAFQGNARSTLDEADRRKAIEAQLQATARMMASLRLADPEQAAAELKPKAKKKKKKGKVEKGCATDGLAPEAEAKRSSTPPASREAGSARVSTKQGQRAASSQPVREANDGVGNPVRSESQTDESRPREAPSEQPAEVSDTEDMPDFVSDSGESDGEGGEGAVNGTAAEGEREAETRGGETGAEESDWENRSEWGDEKEDGQGPAGPRSKDERGAEDEEEWGGLEEDDVEQLLLLGQLQEARSAAPARKKRPPPPGPPKSTIAPPTRPTDAQQPKDTPTPTSFRPKGSPAKRTELQLPGGRLIVNRADFDPRPASARFFVIKSNSVDDVHKSIKYGVWASTPYGNKRLHAAFLEARAEQPPAQVFLLFSVNASGQFCGVAEMMSDVDFDTSVDVWQEDNLWTGRFKVQWHIIKDVPSREFWHIRVPSNDNKPVTNSRDTQDVPYAQGLEMLGIFAGAPAISSILDYFALYDTRQTLLQEDRDRARLHTPPPGVPHQWEQRPELPRPGPGFRPRGPDFVRPPFARPMLVPHNIKTKLCQRYMSPGGCNYGDRCLFAHGVHELRHFRPPLPPGRPPFLPNGHPAFFPPPPFGPGGPHHRPPFWRPEFGNGMGPGFDGPHPPPWSGPPPEFARHDFGHPHRPQLSPSEMLDALAHGQEGAFPEEAEPLGGNVNGAATGDEKDAQDEYLLQLLTEGGGGAMPAEEQGGAGGLADGSEWAGGAEHEDDEVCCICFERRMDAALVPCLHALCRQCAELMQSARSSCPVCNAEIESILPKT